MKELKEIVALMKESIEKVNDRLNTEHGFVVCNKDYVNVGEEHGLNGTCVAIKP